MFAKELGKEITVDTKYAASFADPAKGKALAAQCTKMALISSSTLLVRLDKGLPRSKRLE